MMLVTRHQWLAKSTENITAECEASPSSTKTLCADEHPQLLQMPHRAEKRAQEIFNIIFPFRLQHTRLQTTKNWNIITYLLVMVAFQHTAQFNSRWFSVFFCQLRHNTQSIHYDFQIFTASLSMPSFDPTRTDDDDWRHVCQARTM